MLFSCKSPCKLNLFLYITGKRPDGYHNLQTLFTILDYGDTLYFDTQQKGDIELLTDFGFPQQDNLIYKAAMLLKQYSKCNNGCKIKCDKILLEGGGLGGGSSNAATVLLVLNKLWHLNLSEEELLTLASRLGADVPIFVKGCPCFAQGIGDILTPVTLKQRYYLVCNPKVKVPTALMFAHPKLRKNYKVRSYKELLDTPYENCFTSPAEETFPQIKNLLEQLSKFGNSYMSGSGASCFVGFDNYKQALEALEEMQTQHVKCFLARDCARSPVLQALEKI